MQHEPLNTPFVEDEEEENGDDFLINSAGEFKEKNEVVEKENNGGLLKWLGISKIDACFIQRTIIFVAILSMIIFVIVIAFSSL